ncbi:MAG: NAD(+)/NADH kinase [Planctomycetes bacterium]|nr:NAD(+)/NADH kinase [Planctomycetota bacterium]
MKRRIIIMANLAKPGLGEKLGNLRNWLGQKAEIVSVIDILAAKTADIPEADLCISLGGDGTLLAAARHVAPLGIPMIGVNMGKLGFLAEFTVEQMKRYLDDILEGKISPIERMMLRVNLLDDEKSQFSSLATNDVVITAGEPFRMIELRVDKGADHIATYLGDGVVVSTPTGSTGYNLSSGGPILEPTLDAMIITPVAPHTLSMRPIVVGGNSVIYITATRLNRGTALVIDGQDSIPLKPTNRVEIRQADCVARIFPHPQRSFFDMLTGKLQWGRSPHHQDD